MEQMMQQLANQLFWVLVIVVAGLMGAGIYRLGHRGSKTRMQALLGKSDAPKGGSGSSQPKSSGKKKSKKKRK